MAEHQKEILCLYSYVQTVIHVSESQTRSCISLSFKLLFWHSKGSPHSSAKLFLILATSSTFAMTDTSPTAPQMAASTESSETVATPISDSSAAPPCVPRTHTTLAVTQMLKNLPLISILQMNKEIEEKNAERSWKTFNHTCDPTVYTESGSEEASLISLNNTDLNRFCVPSFAASFPNLIYSKLAKWIANEDIKEKLKLKRKPANEKLSAEDARIAKQCCMNGQKMVPWVMGVPWQAMFPQNLFDTELCIAVPLPFFLNKNLNILNVEASTLPTVKTNPNPGEMKGNVILDIEKLSTRLARSYLCLVASGRKPQVTCTFFRKSEMKKAHATLIACGITTTFAFILLRTLKTSFMMPGNLMNWNFIKNIGQNMGNSMPPATIRLTNFPRSSKKWWLTSVVWWCCQHPQNLLSVPPLQNSHPNWLPALLRLIPPSPFHPAAVDLPPWCPTALSVLSEVMPSSSRVTEKQHGPDTVTGISSALTTMSSASVGISEATVDTHAHTKMTVSISALSVGARPITPSHGLAAHNPQTDAFIQALLPPHLSYSDFSSSIIPREQHGLG